MSNVKRTLHTPTRVVNAELAPPPQWIERELCKLVTRIPAGDNCVHEIKFGSFRRHMRIVKSRAALLTHRLDWTGKYPDVAAAIGALNCRQAYIDGELCAVLQDGTTSFSALQGHGMRLASWCISRSSSCNPSQRRSGFGRRSAPAWASFPCSFEQIGR